MARRKQRQSNSPATTHEAASTHKNEGGMRETIESIAIAFMLAFLFRTFEAEAFVIPTGSMATTLLGRHKDIVCDVCGYHYTLSASEEVDASTGSRQPWNITAGTCPMCHHTMTGLNESRHGGPFYSYNGDRIIATKLIDGVNEPHRWDVVVFRFPEEAQTNFIKRLIGLPNETVQIFHGDIFTSPLGTSTFTIQRKPPGKVRAMLRMVYDNDYLEPSLVKAGWPHRWRPRGEGASSADGWSPEDEGHSFSIDPKSSAPRWLVYQHILPPPWFGKKDLRRDAELDAPRPQLITDATAYNTERLSGVNPMPPPDSLGLHWVGDLALDCQLDTRRSEGSVVLRLIEGGVRFDCELDLRAGTATLSCDARPSFHPTGKTGLSKPGTYHVRFANVDDQLMLWIDERLVKFDPSPLLPPLENHRPTPEDLTPLRIASRGAKLRITHLKVYRDTYYITARGLLSSNRVRLISDFEPQDDPAVFSHVTSASIAALMSTPSKWDVFDRLQPRQFQIKADQFFFLGDNSARSRDARLWEGGPGLHTPHHIVERNLLVGKAIFVYWPHALPTPYHVTLHLFGREVPIPFYPNFHRMGLIR